MRAVVPDDANTALVPPTEAKRCGVPRPAAQYSLTSSYFVPYFNAPIYAASLTSSPTIITYAVAFTQLGSLIGRISAGFLADRFGIWRVFVGIGATCTIVLLAFYVPPVMPEGGIVVGMIGYGWGSGAFMTMCAATVGSISPVRELGMRLGLLWTLAAVGFVAGPVIAGGESGFLLVLGVQRGYHSKIRWRYSRWAV